MCSHHICNHSSINYLSLIIRKPTFWSKTNQAIQLQKMARGLKFLIEKVKGWYYLCSENKGIYVAKIKVLISFVVTAKLICVFVFAYAKRWFSHDVAHLRKSAVRVCV